MNGRRDSGFAAIIRHCNRLTKEEYTVTVDKALKRMDKAHAEVFGAACDKEKHVARLQREMEDEYEGRSK